MSRKMYRTRISDEELPNIIELKLGDETFAFVKKSWEGKEGPIGLRYGTNPHQAAALYVPDDPKQLYFGDMRLLKSGKRGLSATNLEDGYRSLRIVNYFAEPAVSVMKHLNPAGVAVANGNEKLVDVFEKAWSGDPRAAFGSVDGFNVTVDESVAEKIIRERIDKRRKYYVECLFAPDFTPEALSVLKESKDIRAVQVPEAHHIFDNHVPYNIKVFGDAVLLEQPFYTKLGSLGDLEDLERYENIGTVTERQPTESEKQDMLYAWWVCCEKRSNGVVLWKKDKVLAVGTGQQDRIGAIELAIEKAKNFDHNLEGSTLASDGFMLWDNVEPLAEVGVSAIIQPGGSRYDKRVIKKCNEYDIAMIFTGERAFRHF